MKDEKSLCPDFEWSQKALEELNDVPEKRAEALKIFREKVSALESESFKPRTDDEFLMMFLRTKKFDQEKVLNAYLKFYNLRKLNPKIFFPIGKGPLDYKAPLECPIGMILPKRNPIDGTTIIYWSFDYWSPDICDVKEMFTPSCMTVLMRLTDPSVQTYGFRFVYDLRNMHTTYLRFFSISYMRGLANAVQDGFPARYKGLHVIHSPAWYSIFYSMIGPFLKQKIKDRVHVHGYDEEDLHRFIHPSVLPVELGGTEPRMCDSNPLRTELYEQHDKFVEWSHFGHQNI